MKLHFYFIFLCFVFSINSFSQVSDSLFLSSKNGITKHSVLSTHPFGIFISRIQGNFKTKASENSNFKISLESGNVWSPPVTNYIPNNESDRDIVSQYPWHNREWQINVETLDAKTIEIQTDGVLKGIRGNFIFPIGENQEINVGLRTFILSKGKFPFSIFTGDKFIEFFHDNIAGGDDPFDRKLYDLDSAKIRYKDRNDNVMDIDSGDFIIGGFETSYYYYPESLINDSKNLHFNFGAHLGTNISKYNSSLDLGLSANTIKTYSIKQNKNIQIGLSLGVFRRNAVNFKDDNIDFGTNKFIGHLESVLEYNYVSKKGTIHSFGADFYLQTSFNKKDEFDYIVPTKNGTSLKSWNVGWSNTYQNNNYWTFLYSFTKKNTLTLYFQQDFTVNNNPDIQTGISYSFEL